MATTLDKIHLMVAELRDLPPSELGEGGDIAEALQIAEGLGIDVLGFFIPNTDAEADVLVDKLICLLFEVRGDDLPPFDLARYGDDQAADEREPQREP